MNGSSLASLGAGLGESIVSPAVRKALADPATLALAEVQVARILESDQVQKALETSRTGHAVNWNNPDNGNQYTVTPTRTYRTARNGDCRDYDAWVFIGGYERKVTGMACRKPDGTWQQVQG